MGIIDLSRAETVMSVKNRPHPDLFLYWKGNFQIGKLSMDSTIPVSLKNWLYR